MGRPAIKNMYMSIENDRHVVPGNHIHVDGMTINHHQHTYHHPDMVEAHNSTVEMVLHLRDQIKILERKLKKQEVLIDRLIRHRLGEVEANPPVAPSQLAKQVERWKAAAEIWSEEDGTV